MVVFGRNIVLLFIAIGAIEWLTMARIVRGQVQSLKKLEFVDAAISLGSSQGRIIFRHLIPNSLGPIIVYATLTIPAVMLLEAVLSFLGLGVQPPMSSWGLLIKEGAENSEWQSIKDIYKPHHQGICLPTNVSRDCTIYYTYHHRH